MDCCNHGPNSPQNQDGRNPHHQNEAQHQKGHLSHLWMMALCCGAPLALALLVPLLGSGLVWLRPVLLGVLPFLCPIMMVAMVPAMLLFNKRRQRRQDDAPHGPDGGALPAPETKRLPDGR